MESQASSIFMRNRIYITDEQQERIGRAKILLAGAGMGSVIAEYMLRIGFKNLTVIDGDRVEMSNLNRQNYTDEDIGVAKVNALKKRLMEINPLANIRVEDIFLTKDNIRQYISKYDVAINAIDFTSELPFIFDEICFVENIPVLHPYNLGWAAALILLMPGGDSLKQIEPDFQKFELSLVEHVIRYTKKYLDNTSVWLTNVLKEYAAEPLKQPPPQLSVGSALAAALCTRVACSLVIGQPLRAFPEIYYCEA